MQPSPQKDRNLLNPPSRQGGQSNKVSKMGTWFSYNLNVYKKPLIIILAAILSVGAIYQVGSYTVGAVKEYRVERVAELKAQQERLVLQEINALREQFKTQAILTPMTDKHIDEIIMFARASYLDSIKDLSRAFFSMEFVAQEGKYEVVFETTQREMTEIVNEMNIEYTKLLQFMNTFKNSVRTYEAALEAGNKTVLDLTAAQMASDMQIYSDWFKWNVSGQYRKTERVTERANRHINSVVSLENLNKFLASKSTQINNLEPFTSLVMKQ